MRGVVLDVLGRAGHEARSALAEEPNAFHALARYMHRALDLRISAVMPALLGHVSFADTEVNQARDEAVQPMLRLIEAAQSDGSLRADVAFGDIGPLLVRLSRPLPGAIPRDLDSGLAHRELDLALAGMRAGAESVGAPLGGPAVTLDELRALADAGPGLTA
jgi:hypothetical protein